MRLKYNAALAALSGIACATVFSVPAQADEVWQFAPYLRIDLGYSTTRDTDAKSKDTSPGAFNIVGDHSGRYQLGVGLKFNSYLRSDITVSYRKDMAYADTFVSLNSGVNVPTNNRPYETSNTTTMLNVYIDPLAASGIDAGYFSPYLQGGIGWAHNRTKSGNVTSAPNPDIFLAGGENDDLAWQIGAGFNYALSERWKIDVSYRFIDMGKAHAGSVFVNTATAGTWESEPKFDLQAHEFMLGLQYQF